MAEQGVLAELGKLVPVTFRLALGTIPNIETSEVPLLGDEIQLSVTARCVSALLGEKFNPKRNQFTGVLAYTARAMATDAAVVGLRKRSELEADFVKRVRDADVS